MAVITVAPASSNGVQSQTAKFVENGAGTYTANFVLPPDAILLDIIVTAEALWTAGTSASLVVGDSANTSGYFSATNLKATDLLAGESLSAGEGIAGAGGVSGAYLTYGTNTHTLRGPTAANPTTTPVTGIGVARTGVVATVTSVGAGTGGRTRITVLYTTDPGATVITI